MAEIHRWLEQPLNPMSGQVPVDYAWQYRVDKIGMCGHGKTMVGSCLGKVFCVCVCVCFRLSLARRLEMCRHCKTTLLLYLYAYNLANGSVRTQSVTREG